MELVDQLESEALILSLNSRHWSIRRWLPRASSAVWSWRWSCRAARGWCCRRPTAFSPCETDNARIKRSAYVRDIESNRHLKAQKRGMHSKQVKWKKVRFRCFERRARSWSNARSIAQHVQHPSTCRCKSHSIKSYLTTQPKNIRTRGTGRGGGRK